MLNFLDFVSRQEAADTSTGWASYTDTVYTVSNKLALTADTDNPLPNNGAAGPKSQIPQGVSSFWTNNKFTPAKVGDAYQLRVSFTAEIANVSGYFDLKSDIGGDQGEILSRVNTFPKGANTAHVFSSTSSVFALNTFVANGGTVEIRPSHSMNVWDINILITRTHKGR